MFLVQNKISLNHCDKCISSNPNHIIYYFLIINYCKKKKSKTCPNSLDSTNDASTIQQNPTKLLRVNLSNERSDYLFLK